MSPLNLILTGFVRTHSNQFQLAAHSAESNAFYLAASATSISQAKGTKSRGPTRIIHCANSSICLPSNCRMSGLIRFPSESNVSGAKGAIKTPGFTMTMVLVSPRVSSNCIWARAVPRSATGADDCPRFSHQRSFFPVTRSPIDGVLQYSGCSPVVFRRSENHSIGFTYR